MTDFTLIILITFALFIQIEASSYEAKMSEELGMCTSNMQEVWLNATKVNAINKELKRKKKLCMTQHMNIN